jgi:hypothetical protein
MRIHLASFCPDCSQRSLLDVSALSANPVGSSNEERAGTSFDDTESHAGYDNEPSPFEIVAGQRDRYRKRVQALEAVRDAWYNREALWN